MAENKEKDILQTKPPKAKTLNRKFIFMVLVIAAVLLFVALSSLFETPKKTSASNTLADQKLVDNNPALISQLPSSYADMKKMSKYVAGDKSDNTDQLSAEISSLRKELEALSLAAPVASVLAVGGMSDGSISVSVSVAAELVLAGSVSKNVSSSAGWVGSDSGMSASSGSPPDTSLIGSGNKGSSASCAPRVRSLAASSKASPALMRSSLEVESPGAPGWPVSP